MSARLVKVSDALDALADQCHEPARADEPYRRALRVIHARLTATAGEILDRQPEHELDLGLDRYQTPAELLADLDVVDESLRANGSAVLADDRLATTAGSRARLRLSPVRAGYAAELRRARGGRRRAAGMGGRASRLPFAARTGARRAARGGSWPPAGRSSATGAELSELARKELDIVASAARAVKVFGPQAVPNYIISMCQSVSDMLEAAVLLKEVGLLDVSGSDVLRARRDRAALRDHRRPAARLVDSRRGTGPSGVPRHRVGPRATARK